MTRTPESSLGTDLTDSSSGLRLAELVAALSLATDIGTGRPMESALRSCMLAVRFGKTVGLGEAELRDVYYVVLLRFAGCTADSHLAARAFGDEIDFQERVAALGFPDPTAMMRLVLGYVGAGERPLRRARSLATTTALLMREFGEISAGHCEVAQNVARRLGMGKEVLEALGQVFERWDGKGMPNRLKGEEISRAVRVSQLAQDLEVMHRIGGVEVAVAAARERAGRAFDPDLAERFAELAPRLFESLEAGSAWTAVLEAEPGPRPRLSGEMLETGTRAIADFVDLKSPYTVGHSSGVALLAARAAERCGLTRADVDDVRRGGYLHDLGRVGISTGIWGKEGTLTEGEWEQVRLHPYYTERILARSGPLARLGSLASLHHERLDGSGYHRGLLASMLPVTVRILAAADVYHAMTEPRPHREALAPEAAAAELHREVRAGRLDGETANAVLAAAGHPVRSSRRERVAGLTDREVEVLGLLARGLSKKQVAQRLTISKATVDHHVRHIYEKIGVSTRAAATMFAMQHDLVQDTSGLSPGL